MLWLCDSNEWLHLLHFLGGAGLYGGMLIRFRDPGIGNLMRMPTGAILLLSDSYSLNVLSTISTTVLMKIFFIGAAQCSTVQINLDYVLKFSIII